MCSEFADSAGVVLHDGGLVAPRGHSMHKPAPECDIKGNDVDQFVPDSPFATSIRTTLLANLVVGASVHEPSVDPAKTFRDMVAGLPKDNKLPPHTIYVPSEEAPALTQFLLGRLPQEWTLQRDTSVNGGFTMVDSLRCVGDAVRTRQFADSVADAVLTMEQQRANGAIHVVDAGCGSLPVLSIAAALASKRVQCTALEINPRSAEMARAIIGGMGLGNQIEVVETDILHYKPSKKFDVVVSETMDTGLAREPIVQIMAHLRRYVRENGVLLPEKVALHAAFVSNRMDAVEKRSVLIDGRQHSVVEPPWTDVGTYNLGETEGDIHFHLHPNLDPGLYNLLLTNTVHIGGGKKLYPYDSAITLPKIVERKPGSAFVVNAMGRNTKVEVHVGYRPGGVMSALQIA